MASNITCLPFGFRNMQGSCTCTGPAVGPSCNIARMDVDPQFRTLVTVLFGGILGAYHLILVLLSFILLVNLIRRGRFKTITTLVLALTFISCVLRFTTSILNYGFGNLAHFQAIQVVTIIGAGFGIAAIFTIAAFLFQVVSAKARIIKVKRVPQIVVAVALVWLVVSIVLVFTVPVARVLFQSISLIVASVLVTPTCILFYRRIQTIIHNGRDSPSVMMARQITRHLVFINVCMYSAGIGSLWLGSKELRRETNPWETVVFIFVVYFATLSATFIFLHFVWDTYSGSLLTEIRLFFSCGPLPGSPFSSAASQTGSEPSKKHKQHLMHQPINSGGAASTTVDDKSIKATWGSHTATISPADDNSNEETGLSTNERSATEERFDASESS